MSYLGNTPINQSFVSGSDQFSGNGVTTAFTLSRIVNAATDIEVVVANVIQNPYTAYSVSGSTLTFTGAPVSGTNNIYVVYRATNTQQYTPQPLSVPPTALTVGFPTWDASGNITVSGTATITGGIANTFKMNSGYGSVATAYGCRAWVNFNGTGTVAIRNSGNVSSVTDNGTGDYTINFSTAMVDTDYATMIGCSAPTSSNGTTGLIHISNVASVSAVRIWYSSLTSSTVGTDRSTASVAIFR